MENQKVREVTLVSATNKLDNATNADRNYLVSAEVNTSVEKVNSIRNGEVKDLDTGQRLGTFSIAGEYGSNESYNINPGMTPAQRKAIMSDIMEFVEGCYELYSINA